MNLTALNRAACLACVFVLLSIWALATKPSPYRRLFFLPLLLMSFYLLSLRTRYPTADYLVGNAWFTYLFTMSDWILLTEVQRELRLVKPPQRAYQSIEAAPLSQRISWATTLFFSTRGLGWAHEPRYANPPRPAQSTPRGTFVVKQIAEALILIVLNEALNRLNMKNPALYEGGPGLGAYGLVWRYINVWAWSLPMLLITAALHLINAALSVGTGASDPEDWPPFYGSFLHSWSVRGFWGRTWHQNNRGFFSAHGKFLAHKVFGVKRGSMASAYIQLYTAFFVSGVMHYLPEYMALGHWRGRGLVFFLLQAVAITLEEYAQALGRRLRILGSWRWKILGYLWVWSWFAFCLPIWQDPLMHAGVMDEIRYPYSAFASLREKIHSGRLKA